MQQGRGGMDTHKHGISGHPGPNPKFKFMRAFWTNREIAAKPKRRSRMFTSFRDMWRSLKR